MIFPSGAICILSLEKSELFSLNKLHGISGVKEHKAGLEQWEMRYWADGGWAGGVVD